MLVRVALLVVVGLGGWMTGCEDAHAGAPPAASPPAKDQPVEVPGCTPEQVRTGERLHRTQCMACHSTDGSRRVGPTFQDLYLKPRPVQGKTETVIADDAYLLRSLRDPATDLVAGYPPAMPPSKHVPADQDAMVCFIKSLTDPATVEARRRAAPSPPKKAPPPAPATP